MPYLQCPRCHRTAWAQAAADEGIQCRKCGARLNTMWRQDQLLVRAVRERFASDARTDANRARFVRERR